MHPEAYCRGLFRHAGLGSTAKTSINLTTPMIAITRGEHIERHLGCYSRKPFHEKVRCSHPALDSAERMFCRLTTHCHFFWMMIETCLHSLKHGFVLPSGDQSFLAGGAAT